MRSGVPYTRMCVEGSFSDSKMTPFACRAFISLIWVAVPVLTVITQIPNRILRLLSKAAIKRFLEGLAKVPPQLTPVTTYLYVDLAAALILLPYHMLASCSKNVRI